MLSLVAGGAGFVGSHLVDSLLTQGDDVLVIDNLRTGSLQNLEDALGTGRATFIYLDVSRPIREYRETIKKAARGKRVARIFDLASISRSNRVQRPWESMHRMAGNTVALVALAMEQQAQWIYVCDHHENYAFATASEPDDYKEACLLVRDAGRNDYENCQTVLSVAAERLGSDAMSVRLFDCYGPRMARTAGRLVGSFTEAMLAGRPLPIYGDGLQIRSVTFVEDAIRELLSVAMTSRTELAPVNIGSREERTVLDIARTFAAAAGVPFRVEHLTADPGEPQRRRPDLTSTLSLGFVPQTSLADGFAKTIASVRDTLGAYV